MTYSEVLKSGGGGREKPKDEETIVANYLSSRREAFSGGFHQVPDEIKTILESNNKNAERLRLAAAKDVSWDANEWELEGGGVIEKFGISQDVLQQATKEVLARFEDILTGRAGNSWEFIEKYDKLLKSKFPVPEGYTTTEGAQKAAMSLLRFAGGGWTFGKMAPGEIVKRFNLPHDKVVDALRSVTASKMSVAVRELNTVLDAGKWGAKIGEKEQKGALKELKDFLDECGVALDEVIDVVEQGLADPIASVLYARTRVIEHPEESKKEKTAEYGEENVRTVEMIVRDLTLSPDVVKESYGLMLEEGYRERGDKAIYRGSAFEGRYVPEEVFKLSKELGVPDEYVASRFASMLETHLIDDSADPAKVKGFLDTYKVPAGTQKEIARKAAMLSSLKQDRKRLDAIDAVFAL